MLRENQAYAQTAHTPHRQIRSKGDHIASRKKLLLWLMNVVRRKWLGRWQVKTAHFEWFIYYEMIFTTLFDLLSDIAM
jgi:hypothetical protein